MAAGLSIGALVTPIFHFNRVAVENVVQRLDPECLQVRSFDNRAAARARLETA